MLCKMLIELGRGTDADEVVRGIQVDLQSDASGKTARKTLQQQVEGLFRQQLEEAFTSELQLDRINPRAILELQERWGDINSIVTLAGRFNVHSGRSQALDSLREIVLAVLDNKFSAYKYGYSEQLEMLNPEQLNVWSSREKPRLLTIVRASEQQGSSDSEICDQVLGVVSVNLRPHIKGCLPPEAQENFDIAPLNQLLKQGQRKAARQEVARLLTNLNEYDSGESVLVVRQDLQEVLKKLSLQNVSGSRAQLLFSVVVDDAKNLLTIGNAVEAYSCLNYETGFLVEALPGYAMDGNIQAALTFALSAGELGRLQGVFLSRPEDLQVKSFNPERLILELCDTQTQQSQEIYLGKAQRRQILRLGANAAQEAILAAEPPYYEQHQASKAIEQAMYSLIQDYRRMLGISKTAGQAYFPASRNSMGGYSDLGGGIMHGQFSFNIDESSAAA